MHRFRLLVLALTGAALLLLSACGGIGPLAASGTMWVADAEAGIHGFAASQRTSSGSPTADVLISNADGPNGLAFDANGNLWVSLLFTEELAMYTPAQLATTGSPPPQVVIGSDGTSLRQGYAIAFDASGNLWVANAFDNRLEMFTPAQLTTSGSPTPSVVLTNATLNNPLGMAFDGAGALWVASSDADAVVRFTPNQLTVGGAATASVTLTATGASLDRPEGLAFDANGNLWVVNEGVADTLVKFTPAQLAASGSPVPDVTISDNGGALADPAGLAFDDAGDLWVANSGGTSNPVVKFDAADLLTTGAPAAAVMIDGFTGMDVPMIAFEPAP